jgi:molybdenum cofactor cytidylyltransferase
MPITGILLAAGYSKRFGSDKLLYPLADGTPMAVAAAQKLYATVNPVLAVVRPESIELADLLSAEGLQIVNCVDTPLDLINNLAHY